MPRRRREHRREMLQLVAQKTPTQRNPDVISTVWPTESACCQGKIGAKYSHARRLLEGKQWSLRSAPT